MFHINRQLQLRDIQTENREATNLFMEKKFRLPLSSRGVVGLIDRHFFCGFFSDERKEKLYKGGKKLGSKCPAHRSVHREREAVSSSSSLFCLSCEDLLEKNDQFLH